MRFNNPLLCLWAAAASALAQGTYPSPVNETGAHTEFTSTYEIVATPDQVVDGNNTFTGGLAGARGLYKISINSKENFICYDITLTGFRGEYTSPASTATHIHEAGPGKAGPPRIAFPNPAIIGSNTRRSVGCIQGSENGFITGLTNATTGQDQGFGFHVKRIEENPTAFFADVHSSEAVPGAVRGQFPIANLPPASSSAPSYPSGPSSTAPSATPIHAPSNCTGTCPTLTKVYEDCSTTPYGTGAWTPPATGGYTPPPPSTWVKPTGPTTASEPPSYPVRPAASSPVPYIGAGAKHSAFGGSMLFILGGLWCLA